MSPERDDRPAGGPADGAMRLAAGFDVDPDRAERDMARLVLALVETLRELMERQAIRHLEAGALTPAQEERVGAALERSRRVVREVAGRYGIPESELRLAAGLRMTEG